ncbi:hypothetical protein N7481_003007 [Penicillium waksmanii]|uniref:uncharacterized protein n=1 Tax=Penicillium waksmanii TaxID=69791 RepID=UPI002548EB30|nr:uncharacterized protein N7481_003007 [Penicillium waksmanii]KAJ5987797.1 hypothetical protein N7481_003007 [Penicillium waksmanii]
MGAVIIGHTTPFGIPETETQIELVRIRKIVWRVTTMWSAKRGRPLDASIHAPANLRRREQAEFERVNRASAAEVALEIYRQEVDISYQDEGLTQAIAAIVRIFLHPRLASLASLGLTCEAALHMAWLDFSEKAQVDGIKLSSNAGTNPAAAEFTPAANPEASPTAPANAPTMRHVSSPQEFLDSFKAVHTRGFNLGGQKIAPRRIAFKNVPEWATYSDMLCLVHGGAVDRIFRGEEHEFIVQFCDEESCTKYLEAYPSGIKVEDDHIIEVVRVSGSDKILPTFTSMMENEASRLVRLAPVPLDKTLQDLHDLASGLTVDHILYNARADCPGSAYFFFCGVTHGNRFFTKIEEEQPWDECEVGFMTDPCKTAEAFHGNSIPYQMSTAEAA